MGGELGSPLGGVSRAIVLVTGKAASPPTPSIPPLSSASAVSGEGSSLGGG